MKRSLLTSLTAASLSLATAAPAPPDDGKLRIICFGAHPDDCELQAGGVAMMWARKGHHVKLVSVTNGDIGHWREAGGPLALRRKAEVERAAEILGVTTEVLDIHDGELLPTIENRRLLTRLIREWKADLVLGPRPNDYHPDHRYVGVLVQDAAYMVTVPFFCPDVPYLKHNPVFLYTPTVSRNPIPSSRTSLSPPTRSLKSISMRWIRWNLNSMKGAPTVRPSSSRATRRNSRNDTGRSARILLNATKITPADSAPSWPSFMDRKRLRKSNTPRLSKFASMAAVPTRRT